MTHYERLTNMGVTQILVHINNTKTFSDFCRLIDVSTRNGAFKKAFAKFAKDHNLKCTHWKEKRRAISRHTPEEMQEAANKVKSLAGFIKILGGCTKGGGTYDIAKKYLQKYFINTDHWTGQGWSKDIQQKDWSQYKNNSQLKVHLLKLKGYSCECCKLDEWLGSPISLEVHHIDGCRVNNTLSNLQLLCPNCHSKTDNYRNKNRSNPLTNQKQPV